MPEPNSNVRTTSTRVRCLVLARALVCAAIIGSGAWALHRPGRTAAGAASAPGANAYVRPAFDPNYTPRAIATLSRHVREDKQDWLSLSMLAGHYLQHCRETGDIGEAVRAEQLARRSLALFGRANQGARNQLAMSLLTQHRFPEALSALTEPRGARTKVAGGMTAQTRLLRAEILMEIGEYSEATAELEAVRAAAGGPNAVALWARSLELNGSPLLALKFLQKAQSVADLDYDMPAPNAAWFHMRVGNLLADMGRADEARRAYTEALRIFPHDYRTLTSLARLEAGRGDWQAVLDWGRRSAAVVPTPEVVALLGDAYTALGRKHEAEEQYAQVEAIAKIARSQGVVYDRYRALFCADHGRGLNEAVALARRELRVRHDIYAYDTLAWACTRSGLNRDARAAMAKALSRGTEDARLFYHAGICALADGDRARAKEYLARALRVNPYFLPFAPQRARELLAGLDRP